MRFCGWVIFFFFSTFLESGGWDSGHWTGIMNRDKDREATGSGSTAGFAKRW